MLRWPKVLSKWADGLGQVYCQHGTFAKLCTSCPCEVEFEVVVFFFKGDWNVHKNSSLRMFWYRDLNSSHVLPCFGSLEDEANRTWDICATFIGSRKKSCKGNRMSVCQARKRKPSILSVSYRLDHFNRCSRWKTTPLQIFCQNMVRTKLKTNYNTDVKGGKTLRLFTKKGQSKIRKQIYFMQLNWMKLETLKTVFLLHFNCCKLAKKKSFNAFFPHPPIRPGEDKPQQNADTVTVRSDRSVQFYCVLRKK